MEKLKSSFFLLAWPLGALILTLCMFLFPQATFAGAKFGLETWAFTLVPSLLPFMIMADMLIELGIVRFFGVLLEPLMRPVFKQPGEAGFAVAMGFTSGFPMGAILTTSLYEKKICSKNEATRLVTFTNNASPLFLLVAIPVGMLHAPQLGIIFILSHYLSNLIIGVASGFFAPKIHHPPLATHGLLSRSIAQLLQSRREQALPIGSILGQGVNKGIKNILSIGGFVLFFSVLISIMEYTHFFRLTDAFFGQFIHWIRFDPSLVPTLSRGLLEMTLGTKGAATTQAPLLQKIIVISFILGWSGFSIHAQVGSIISPSGIPLWPYSLCRLIQGILAATIAPILFVLMPDATTTLLPTITMPLGQHIIGVILIVPILNLSLLLALSLAIYWLSKVKRLFRLK